MMNTEVMVAGAAFVLVAVWPRAEKAAAEASNIKHPFFLEIVISSSVWLNQGNHIEMK